MSDHHENWVRVSQQNPCPICGKPDNCTVLRDGGAVWCGRVAEGSISDNAGGQFLHRLGNGRSLAPDVRSTHSKNRSKRGPTKDWAAIADRFRQEAGDAVAKLAMELGVAPMALNALNVGWCPRGKPFWSFPERDGDGRTIGINARFIDGLKERRSGSKSGLTYADDWDTGHGPILLVEGGSDTAALMTIGLSVIGRPSNRGGVDLLVDLLCDVSMQREIVVIGERDEKTDGNWPGRDGAISTAKKLAEQLGRPVSWSLCPENAKDAREWLRSTPDLPEARLSALFVEGLGSQTIQPPVVLRAESPRGPEVSIDDWRDEMQSARLRSLKRRGYYLDTSPPGSGKSYADYLTLLFAFGRRGRDMRELLVYPTHENCREVEKQLLAGGLEAACYPGRTTKDGKNQNCWNVEADQAQKLGFPVVRTVCLGCENREKCEDYGYLGQLRIAEEAGVAICTHKRAEYTSLPEMMSDRQYLSIHENPIDLLRPKMTVSEIDIVQAQIVLGRVLNDPRHLNWFGSVWRFNDEKVMFKDEELKFRKNRIYEFCRHLADLIDVLLAKLQSSDRTTEWVPSITHKKPTAIERTLFFATKIAEVSFKGPAWRLILSAASGELKTAAIAVSGPPGKGKGNDVEVSRRSVIGVRHNQPPPTVTTWINDATITRDRLEMILNHQVQDETPGGHLPLQKKAVQLLRDVKKRTAPGVVADILRGVMADRPQFKRIGVICHRRHISVIETLSAEFTSRIVKSTYFRSGEDRSSNEWHKECDLLIIVGTPRVPPVAIAEFLMQVGEVGAACREPDWGVVCWMGTTESGEPVRVEAKGYQDEVWRRAHRDLVRAQIVQAVGRGRGILETGCEVIVLSDEECGLVISDVGMVTLTSGSVKVMEVLQRLAAEKSIDTYIENSAVTTREIAQETRLSTRRVREILQDLERRGLVRKVGERKGWLPVSPELAVEPICNELKQE